VAGVTEARSKAKGANMKGKLEEIEKHLQLTYDYLASDEVVGIAHECDKPTGWDYTIRDKSLSGKYYSGKYAPEHVELFSKKYSDLFGLTTGLVLLKQLIEET